MYTLVFKSGWVVLVVSHFEFQCALSWNIDLLGKDPCLPRIYEHQKIKISVCGIRGKQQFYIDLLEHCRLKDSLVENLCNMQVLPKKFLQSYCEHEGEETCPKHSNLCQYRSKISEVLSFGTLWQVAYGFIAQRLLLNRRVVVHCGSR